VNAAKLATHSIWKSTHSFFEDDEGSKVTEYTLVWLLFAVLLAGMEAICAHRHGHSYLR
jgi:hypothetical protein